MQTTAKPTVVLPRPFSRVGDRVKLFADLSYAVDPGSGPSVLVIFGFEGLKERLESIPPVKGDELLGGLADCLVRAVGTAAALYETRRGEFCALFDGPLVVVRSFLVTVPAELDEDAQQYEVRSSLGIAVLPNEATDPTYALALADRRLRALSGNLRPALQAQGEPLGRVLRLRPRV
jgi:hypothetical protein